MKQVIQNYRTGKLELAEVPTPTCSNGNVLVQNHASLISLGTEKSIIELGKKSLMGKARTRPDLVKRFTEKAKKEGVVKTFKEALDRLDNATPLGYSSAGIVAEVGGNVHRFSPGDRVACIGAGYAGHAEYVSVPKNLCCIMPDTLNFDQASFGMLGIIALHGIRCAEIAFGESVAVIGLGLLGLLTVQILKAYGSQIIGMDIDAAKVKMAKQLGADFVSATDEDFQNSVKRLTVGHGADAAIITASTKSDAPINSAVDIVRYGGRVVMVGVGDIHPNRNEMWHKEVEIVVSKAGGPGTFDPTYENRGIDYPMGYARWTENRNLVEFLRLIAEKMVDVTPMISHRFKIGQAETLYKDMLENRGGPYVGVVLEYPQPVSPVKDEVLSGRIMALGDPTTGRKSRKNGAVTVGVIGAGLFGRSLLLPALKKISGIHFETIATSSAANAHHTGRKYGFRFSTTDYTHVLSNRDIDSVIILTPHSMHARMVIKALEAGKHVFVEKPLCINNEELDSITRTYEKPRIVDALKLIVGYNRRFSPHSMKIAEYLTARKDPMVINYRVNAGFVPPDHWVHSEEEGGSRVIGEICHFVDLLQFLTGSDPIRVYAERISGNNKTSLSSDNLSVTLKFDEGSVGNILYCASGDRASSRERVEIYCEGKSIISEDFRQTAFYRSGKKKTFKTISQQMGYYEELKHFFNTIRENVPPLLTPRECFISTLTVLSINKSLEKGFPMEIRP